VYKIVLLCYYHVDVVTHPGVPRAMLPAPSFPKEVPLTRSLKRSREAENFDGVLQSIETKYGIPVLTEAQRVGWSPSRRNTDLAKCLAVMRHLFWKNADVLGDRLDMFDNLTRKQQTLQALLALVEEVSGSNDTSPIKLSPIKESPPRKKISPNKIWEYRSSSGEDSMLTSFTSNASRSGVSTTTSVTEYDPSPPSSGQKQADWDYESLF
jgi:hypothetical protein